MKKLVSLILVFVMALSFFAIGASAAQKNDYIYWNDESRNGAYVLKLDGYVGLGESELTASEENFDYNANGIVYELNVPEDGCYIITFDCIDLDVSEEYAGDEAYGYEEYAQAEDDGRIYYLQSGTLLIYAECYENRCKINVAKYDGERPAATYDAQDYIKEIVVENLESAVKCFEYYDGTCSFSDPRENGGKVVAKFKDGTQTEVTSYCDDDGWHSFVTLPNGEEFEVIIYQRESEENGLHFVVSVDEYRFVVEEFEVEKRNFKANSDYFKAETGECMAEIAEGIKYIAASVSYIGNTELFMENLAYSTRSIAVNIRWLFDDIVAFISYWF